MGDHWVRVGSWTGRLVGISATQAPMQNADFDLEAWLDDLEAHGIRAAMVWSFMAVRQTADGSVFDRRWARIVPGITPWSRNSGGPAAIDGLPRWDLTAFDETDYWPRFRRLVEETERRGMRLWITVFDGWLKRGGDTPYHPFRAVNGGPLARDEDFVRLAEYGEEIAGDYDPNWPWERRNQWLQERFADRLAREVAGRDHVILELFNEGEWYDPEFLKRHQKHFAKFFRARVSAPIAVNADHLRAGDPWVDLEPDIVSWHTNGFDPASIHGRWLEGYRRTPAKPVVNSETVPEYDGGGEVSDDEIRSAVWAVLMAGGHIFVQDDTAFGFDRSSPGRRGDGMRREVGIADRFFARPELDDASLSPCRVASGTAFCLTDGHGRYVLYLPHGGTTRLATTVPPPFRARWFDPRLGRFGEFEPVAAGAEGLVVSAPEQGDWVVEVEARGGDEP